MDSCYNHVWEVAVAEAMGSRQWLVAQRCGSWNLAT